MHARTRTHTHTLTHTHTNTYTHPAHPLRRRSQPAINLAIKASNVPRSSLWVTSKLNVESCGTDMSSDMDNLILAPLGLDYVDLLLLHHAGRWETDKNPHPACFDASAAGPAGNGTYYSCRMQTVLAMEKLVAAG